MKQKKPFRFSKEQLYDYLESKKEFTVIVMFSVLIIGFFINVYLSYFSKEESIKNSNIENFNIDKLLSKPPSLNINSTEALELIELNELLKDSTLTKERLLKISKRIDQIMSKKTDTSIVPIK